MSAPIEIVGVGIATEASTGLVGHERFDALAAAALAACGARPDAAVVLGSCNGGAHDLTEAAWLGSFRAPTASAACASGLHALFLAKALLESGARREVVALAVDIGSPANQSNFEVLRVTADAPQRPWQEDSAGFVLGEAAVALRLQAAGSGGAPIWGPTLAIDELDRALERVDPASIDIIVGQGTGPFAVDRAELEALAAWGSARTPITSAVFEYGHTLGCSGLLGVALAARRARVVLPVEEAIDGRPITRSLDVSSALIACRAMGGACAVVTTCAHARREPRWIEPVAAPPIMIDVARALAHEASDHRPTTRPEAVVVRLEHPLLPPERARIGGRLLPSAILEMTPGFLAHSVARAWGFDGPALCVVGGLPGDGKSQQSLALSGIEAAREVLGEVRVIYVRGNGHEREVDWGP